LHDNWQINLFMAVFSGSFQPLHDSLESFISAWLSLHWPAAQALRGLSANRSCKPFCWRTKRDGYPRILSLSLLTDSYQ
jgi:hypothetical protein